MLRRRGENSSSYLQKDQIEFNWTNRGDDSPIAATYILVEDSDNAFPTSRLQETRNREQDGVQHGIRECDIPVTEILLLGFKVLQNIRLATPLVTECKGSKPCLTEVF